jgi:hypothetical protein
MECVSRMAKESRRAMVLFPPARPVMGRKSFWWER